MKKEKIINDSFGVEAVPEKSELFNKIKWFITRHTPCFIIGILVLLMANIYFTFVTAKNTSLANQKITELDKNLYNVILVWNKFAAGMQEKQPDLWNSIFTQQQ